LPVLRFDPELGVGTLCGLFVETDVAKGLAKRCEPIRVGGRLSELLPN
ncbi:MAG: metallophosphoesterase, partial [Pseudomonadota bacterium]